MAEQPLTPDEFVSLFDQGKLSLIDKLAQELMSVGYQAAMATAEHYRVKLTDKNDKRLPELTAQRALLEGKYDTLKHVVSALQSTLRAERELDR